MAMVRDEAQGEFVLLLDQGERLRHADALLQLLRLARLRALDVVTAQVRRTSIDVASLTSFAAVRSRRCSMCRRAAVARTTTSTSM
jgi:uncharacterized sporulation protein YeaH/YhbH (DUF444 family)